MAQLLIRSLDDDVKEKLRRRASSHGVSLEEEARQILREAANEPVRDQYGLGSEIASLFADFGITEDIPEFKGGGFSPPSLMNDCSRHKCGLGNDPSTS